MEAPNVTCDHPEHDGKTLFCPTCGKATDKAALRSVRFEPRFLGTASTNPKMEQFWATGDPSVFDRP